ncbi:MAG: CHAT domain-containing protein [Azonexus sp.]|nr:CHAT domain-containing protein [Betaproteobacteria bacterium]MBK8917230.1 CHAT domain-containing protein [Betaproteobacteria bacterium]MBP6035626.1 CHAT domain-containing protein [Azonexus sp.]MBP6906140.1 CHAT domain-containing protein [Azonexus sp.]
MDLFLLNGFVADQALVVARRGPDTAVTKLDLAHAELQEFIDFTERIEQVALGGARPTVAELDDIGTRLFDHIFQGEVLRLYNRVPTVNFSIQIATDDPKVQRIPWEFIRPHDRLAVPHRDRCVVRVLPICAPADPAPAKSLKKLKVLLAVADPIDQAGVTWHDVESSIRRAFEAQTEGLATLKVIPGATSRALRKALEEQSYDVFHFLGHGCIVGGEGRLVLVDVATKKSDFMTARQVASALSGQNLRLVILSACLSGAGDIRDDFGPVANALISSGILAVVANQTSIPTKSVAPFVGALYQRLLRDGNIDAAVMSGRVALQDELRKTIPLNSAVVEWGIPALYRLPGGAQLFTPRGEV